MSRVSSADYEVDVAIVGGGSAGVPAAIAAARCGVSCILIERYGFLGGTANIITAWAGFTDRNGVPVVAGIGEEFVKELVQQQGSHGHIPNPVSECVTPVDAEVFKFVAAELAMSAGVQLLLHTVFANAEVEDSRISTISVLNKSGVQSIRAKVYVDCSGDADVAAAANAPFQIEDQLQPVTMTFRMGGFDKPAFLRYLEAHPEELAWDPRWSDGFTVEYFQTNPDFGFFKGFDKTVERVKRQTGYEFARDRVHFLLLPRAGEVQLNTTRIRGINSTSIEDLTRAEIEARRQVMGQVRFLNEHIPGFSNAHLVDTSVQVGIRESRRIEGEYILDKDDTLQGRQFKDNIGKGVYPVDIHDPNGRGMMIQRVQAPYGLPYRMLVAKGVRNLLVAGRCASMSHEGLASPRTIPTCMAMGQAAGVAAAICSRNGTTTNTIDIDELQAILIGQGVLL